MRYQVQWIKYNSCVVPIILQLINGPCPLIAICNVLFLRRKLTMPPNTLEVAFEDLCATLRTYLQRQVAHIVDTAQDDSRVANSLKNLEDVIGVLPKLESGLDINIRFCDPLAYEFTTELALFDLCGVRLVHGWTYDSQDEATKRVIANMSYNELVTYLTTDLVPLESDSDEEKSSKLAANLRDKTTAQSFLNDTQSQLSIAGLAALHSVLADEELAVLFRNNHFSVVLKHNTRLYTLCTDAGLVLAAPYIVWSYVNDVQGDQLFLDHDFKRPHPDTVAYYARASNQQQSPSASPIYQQSPTAIQAPPGNLPPSYAQSSSSSSAAVSLYSYPGAGPAVTTNPFAGPTPPPTMATIVPSAPLPPPTAPLANDVNSGGGFPAIPYVPVSASVVASSSAPQSAAEILQQQRQFAEENNLIWNEQTQNYEPKPIPYRPPQQPQQQQSNSSQSYTQKRQQAIEKKKKKDSCSIQ